METLTFPYGETPKDVIRRRFDALGYAQSKGSGALKEIAVDEGEVTPRVICGFRDTDDLLTVLDALKSATGPIPTYCTGHPPEVDGDPADLYNLCDGSCGNGRGWEDLADMPAPFALYLSILTALGIKEG